MCFDRNASPPILAGDHAIGRSGRLTLQSSDGTQFGAFEAVPDGAAEATVLILPDVRGLHPYYEELACRFAQHGYRSLAIDYFGRTAPPLRSTGSGDIFTIGFCFGGRLSFLSTTFGLDLAGAIGLHAGLGPRNDFPPPAERAADMRSPVLGLFGGADPSIPPEAIAEFDAALTAAGVEHRFVTFDGAPHSFFDRKFTEFAEQNAAAWQEVLAFVGRGERVAA
jgi:carboxymethylenebutenolidase